MEAGKEQTRHGQHGHAAETKPFNLSSDLARRAAVAGKNQIGPAQRFPERVRLALDAGRMEIIDRPVQHRSDPVGYALRLAVDDRKDMQCFRHLVGFFR